MKLFKIKHFHYVAIVVLFFFCARVVADSIAANATNNVESATEDIKIVGNYKYLFKDTTIKDILNKYCVSKGYILNIATAMSNESKLNQRVTLNVTFANENMLLTFLSQKYGFLWFVYNNKLYIDSNRISVYKITMDHENFPILRSYLNNIGLLQTKFNYIENVQSNELIFTGPSSYLGLITDVVNQLNIKPYYEKIQVYKLKYANAIDLQLTLSAAQNINLAGVAGEQQQITVPPVTVPGVATILTAILHPNNANDKSATYTMSKSDMSKLLPDSAINNIANNSVTNANSLPVIQPDPRLNAVIIKDNVNNFPIYDNLIKQLDILTPIIQLEVQVINVNQSKLKNTGVDWWGSLRGVNIGSNFNGIAASYGVMSPGTSGVLKTNNAFAANLQLLEESGFAKTVSKPVLATMDSIPSVLIASRKTISNVQFQRNSSVTESGKQNSNTTTTNVVTSQTSLQITPHLIVEDNGKRRIALSIALQDYTPFEFMNDFVQNGVSSQAVVTEGQSLLIAGYSYTTSDVMQREVPLLGDIPIIGWLFKYKMTKQVEKSTLYLITPKVVDIDKV
jgi:type III secretion system YscC/HrcC family outer membrane pore protein